MSALKGIGPAIALLRESSGLTKADLARALEVTKSTVTKLESADGWPNTRNLDQVLDLLKKTPYDLAEALDLANGRTPPRRLPPPPRGPTETAVPDGPAPEYRDAIRAAAADLSAAALKLSAALELSTEKGAPDVREGR